MYDTAIQLGFNLQLAAASNAPSTTRIASNVLHVL